MKTCNRCQKQRSVEEFTFSHVRGNYQAECKPCIRARSKEWYKANKDKALARQKAHRKSDPDRYRNVELKREYGITLDDYNRMYEQQGGRCKICDAHGSGLRRRLVVDHCHATGAVRALLCNDCNRAIGLLRDRAEVVEAAAAYLRSYA